MTQKQLGSFLELSDEKMSLLMKGKLELTQDIADQLEDALGIPSLFWLNQNIVFDYLFISSHKPV